MNNQLRLRIDSQACHEAMWKWLTKYSMIDGRLSGKQDWPGWKTIKRFLEAGLFYNPKKSYKINLWR